MIEYVKRNYKEAAAEKLLKKKQIKAINALLTFNYLTLLIDFANKFVYILKRSSNFEIVNVLSIELSHMILIEKLNTIVCFASNAINESGHGS